MRATAAISVFIAAAAGLLLTSCAGGERIVIESAETEYVSGETSQTAAPAAGTGESAETIVAAIAEPETTSPEDDPVNAAVGSEYDEIVLNGAESFKRLLDSYLPISCYLGVKEPVFELGEAPPVSGSYFEVISDSISCYEDVKREFSGTVSEEYTDYLLTRGVPCYKEIDGKLCYGICESSCIGSLDAWYLGCGYDGERITGHFALLLGMETEWAKDADFLNDPRNYHFYDLIFENADGNWVICDTDYVIEGVSYSNGHEIHGCFYNAGAADKALITYEKAIPYSMR